MQQFEFEPVQLLRQRLVLAVVFVGVILLLGACSSVMPEVTSPPPPDAASAAPGGSALLASASPAASPASDRPLRVPDALLSPADLVFDAAYSAAGWHRCDDYVVGKNLEDFRSKYKVVESAAAVWEYGGKCGSAGQAARLDEYAWRLPNQDAVVKLSGYLGDMSYFDQLTPELRKQVREFERDSVLVRVSPIESFGKKRYVAEMIGQASLDVAYIRITTSEALTDVDYLGMARVCLARLGSGAK